MVDVIKIFFNEIKTQFCEPLRVFRTDNVLEYVQLDVSFMCEDQELFTKLLALGHLNRTV